MKVTANKAIEVLHLLGLKDAELVEDDAQVEYDEDAALLAVDEARTPVIKHRIEGELRKNVETVIAGKVGEKLRRTLRDKFNLPIAELRDLDDEAAITKAVEHYSSTMQQDTAGLREEINKLSFAHAEALNKATAEKDSEVAAWKSKYADRHILDFVVGELKDAPLNPNADRLAAAKLVKQQLEAEGVVFDYDEATNKVNMLDKTTGAQKFNTKGNAPLVLMEGAETVLKPFGMWEKDTRSIPPVGPTNRGGQDYQPAPANGGATDPKVDPARAKAEQTANMMGGK